MRLCRFEIRNFKGIQDASFDWDDIIVLIGENNVGKSSVLQALNWFLSGSQIKDELVFYNKLAGPDHAIELVGHFDALTDEEMQAQAVRGRMHDDKWIIKKRFWAEAPEADRIIWREQYYSYSSKEIFANWPEQDTAWRNFTDEYQDLIAEIGSPRATRDAKEQLKNLVRERKRGLIQASEPEWIENPGGGGNWKSNANSIMPRFIMVEAVHDATTEGISKETSAYGRIVNLIVERRFIQRPEVQELRQQLDRVLMLFRRDPRNPDQQADEIREIQDRINDGLGQVIGGVAVIKTSEIDVRPMFLPNTTLLLKDCEDGIETNIRHQGHGLQRTLIMTLVQLLTEIEREGELEGEGAGEAAPDQRAVVLAIEEPELYMHPQMERKMRDALYILAGQPHYQVICSTHSPVFLDMAQRHKSIVRLVRNENRQIRITQVTRQLFEGNERQAERDRLRLIATFNPTVNEVFFAKRIVLLEELTAVWVFERAAQLMGLFDRHPGLRWDVSLINCAGIANILMFQEVLNHFRIPHTVIHDEDRENPVTQRIRERIGHLLDTPEYRNTRYMIRPDNMEEMLGYRAGGRDKPYQALRRVEQLHRENNLPYPFVTTLHQVYFGQDDEPRAN